MKSRTCPGCQYTYSFKEYLKKIFPKGLACKWKCANCGKELSTSRSRRIFLALLGIAPVILVPEIAKFFISADFTPLVSWVGTIVLFLMWAIGVFSFEVFILNETPQEEE